tara:strand:- start:190 stop:459 length:270 start_codon:yes stop_codon:yes gene_type:complete
MLKIRVLYFAIYREQAETGCETINMEGAKDSITLGGLVNKICNIHPKILASPERIVGAVNEEYREHSHVLKEGDTVALIPPVSGGSQFK